MGTLKTQVLTRHIMEPTHSHGNFKISKSSHNTSTEPTHGNSENSKSSHTTVHGPHAQRRALWKISKSSHTRAQGPHTGELWKLKVLTHHNIEPTHMGTLKLKVFTHQSTEPTPRGTLKTQSPHSAHTQGNFEKSQSLYTPQHRDFLRTGRMTVL